MKKNQSKKLVPTQKKGQRNDVKKSVMCKTSSEAKEFFKIIKQRLLNVNRWQTYAGKMSANFKLCDAAGNEVNRRVRRNDYFKIDIPGPGTVEGKGFDWAKVEAIEELTTDKEEYIAIRARAAKNPKNNDTNIAHFFSKDAISSFIIHRRGRKILIGIYGRNETPNTDTNNLIDKTRNAIIGVVAASIFSKVQWESLINGFLQKM